MREYVLRRYPPAPHAAPGLERVARLVHRHTDGNPLFAVNVLGELARRSLLEEHDGGWDVSEAIEAALPLPDDVRRMIDQRIDALEPDERDVLEVASLVPGVFSAEAIAAGVQTDTASVEQVLRGLARRHWFVREAQAVAWPDGTSAAGFELSHALYRETLQERLPSARRAEVHRRIGGLLERAYGERAPEIAADLAVHFDRARDARKAIVYLRHAADTDRRRAANQEAEAHLRRALQLLETLPPSAERDELEVTLRIALGGALMAVRGFGAPEVEDCFARAHRVCQQLTGDAHTFPVQWGLWLFYLGRGSMRPARELADRLLATAASLPDPDLRLQAHHALWATALSEGDLAAVERHADAGIAIYEPERHASMAAVYGDHDPGVCALLFAARAAALAGRTATAVRLINDALALAGELAHPFTVTLALAFASFVQQSRGDLPALRGHAAAGAALAREHGFALMLGWLTALDGWALAKLGEHEQGLRGLRDGIAAARSTGSELFQPTLLVLQAEAELAAGLRDDARRTLAAAAGIAAANGDRLAAAEIERLEGELCIGPGAELAAREEGERRLRSALEIATSQGAALLALRAGVRLGHLYAASGRTDEARRLVMSLCERVVEEPALPEVVAARVLCGAAA